MNKAQGSEGIAERTLKDLLVPSLAVGEMFGERAGNLLNEAKGRASQDAITWAKKKALYELYRLTVPIMKHRF